MPGLDTHYKITALCTPGVCKSHSTQQPGHRDSGERYYPIITTHQVKTTGNSKEEEEKTKSMIRHLAKNKRKKQNQNATAGDQGYTKDHG